MIAVVFLFTMIFARHISYVVSFLVNNGGVGLEDNSPFNNLSCVARVLLSLEITILSILFKITSLDGISIV